MRRIRLHNFPFGLFYQVRPDEILILAVMDLRATQNAGNTCSDGARHRFRAPENLTLLGLPAPVRKRRRRRRFAAQSQVLCRASRRSSSKPFRHGSN